MTQTTPVPNPVDGLQKLETFLYLFERLNIASGIVLLLELVSGPFPALSRGSGVGVSELVHKYDITKIQTSEIMRFVSKLFRKNKMKKAPLPKTSF